MAANKLDSRLGPEKASKIPGHARRGGSILEAGVLPLQAAQLMAADTSGGGMRKTGKRHLIVVTTETPPFMSSRQVSLDDMSLQTVAGEDYARVGNKSIKAIPDRWQPDKSVRTEWYGYCVEFFEELIKHLPYEVTYELYRAPDGKFGSKSRQVIIERDNKTGKVLSVRKSEQWNGVVGELANKRAHVALVPLAVMAERELVMDFTVPFYDLVGIQILLKRAEVPKDWFKFLTVLDNDVWLSIFVAYFVTSFVIYLFDRLSPYSNKNAERIKRLRRTRRQSSLTVANTGSQQLTGAADSLSKTLNASLLSVVHQQPSKLFAIGGLGASSVAPFAANQQNSVTKWRRQSHDYMQSIGLSNATKDASTRVDHNPDANRNKHNDHDDDNDDDEDNLNDGDPQRPKFNLRDSFWFCITSLTPQGGGEAPQNLSGRVVAGAWWLFCFIVIASYTANLAAFLTVSRLDIPVESLDDLAKQYRIKYAPMDGTAEQTYFERMAYIEEIFYNIWKEMSLNDSLSEQERAKFAVWDYPISDKYTRIWAQIQEVGMPRNATEAMARVKSSTLDDGFALLADANFVKFATMTDCSFKAVGEEFSRKPIALGVAKGNEQLRDDMSYAILHLINQRFMEVLREKWWTNNEARVLCSDSSDESSEGMSIENIGGVFIIILAGVILSFIVWTIERFVYKTRIEVSRNLILSGTRPSLPLNALR